MAARKPLRIVCAREFQNSIEESVHHLLEKRIKHYGLPFTVDKYRIFNAIGSEFIFKGLSKQDAAAIKSLEGADIVWVEEAQNVSHASWQNLIPTVRAEGSEIWVTFNPDTEDAPTYQRFVVNPPPTAHVIKVNWNDNPWFPTVLDEERRHMLATDPQAYDNVWRGNARTFAEGAFFQEQMQSLERGGRIGDVPHKVGKPVSTFWDLGGSSGKGDSTAIWWVQPTDTNTYDIIDYWEGNNVDLTTIARDVIQERGRTFGYSYALHLLPHDGGHESRQTGKNDAEILRPLVNGEVEVAPRVSDKSRAVNAIRVVLPRCRFDKVKTKNGLACLRGHRQEKDPKSGLWRFKHDWTSHGVDAFQGFVAYQDENEMGGMEEVEAYYSPRTFTLPC